MREYHDLYLETDVILLADVFENFREICMKHYGLDPAHYYTAPGLAYDAALKVSNIKLDLITDPNMLLMIEKGIRGGLTMASQRYARANNPYVQDFDPSKPTNYLMYLDANSSGSTPWKSQTSACSARRLSKYISWKWISNTPRSSTIVTTTIPWRLNPW